MTSKIFRKQSRALVAAFILISVFGCAGRKQYQINEAILISERRQLEDEIYRLQFELRDALEENERLRAATEGSAPKSKKIETARGGDVFAAQRSPIDVGNVVATFPESPALRVSRPTRAASANAGNLRGATVAPSTGGEVETLPDYVPIPLSTAPARNANSFGVRRGVVGSSKIAASNYVGNVAAPSSVESTNYQDKGASVAIQSASVDSWSPLAP